MTQIENKKVYIYVYSILYIVLYQKVVWQDLYNLTCKVSLFGKLMYVYSKLSKQVIGKKNVCGMSSGVMDYQWRFYINIYTCVYLIEHMVALGQRF